MADIDRLKETKSDLREYKILIGSIPVYISILGGVGLIVTFLSVLYTLKVWSKMQELNKEMKNAD